MLLITLMLFSLHSVNAELEQKRIDTLKLQIFLNSKNFGTGHLDGYAGGFTMLAVNNYNRQLDRDPTDFRFAQEAQAAVEDALLVAVVPSFIDNYVDANLSSDKEKQAELKFLPYRDNAEFMAERYNTTAKFLAEINGSKKMKNLKPRDTILVPNVNPFMIENLKTGKSFKAAETIKDRYIIIDTTINQIKIYQKQFLEEFTPKVKPTNVDSIESMIEADKAPPKPKMISIADKLTNEEKFEQLSETDLIATFPITPGKEEFIHRGYWKVKTSVELPIWRYDKSLLEKGVRGKEYLIIPGGPNNPVGVMWHGLTKSGIGIHGTSTPETIGRSESAGCIRLANWDVVKLPELMRPGTQVWLK